MDNAEEEIKAGFFNNDMVQRQHIDKATKASLKKLSETDTKDAKGVAASQIELLSEFYQLSISHSNRSFRWALTASIAGLVFFCVAIYLQQSSDQLSTIALVGGALIEFIAGVNFYLYGKTLTQLNMNQESLTELQRFLVANSLCENLGSEYKDETRAGLISQLVGSERVYSRKSQTNSVDRPRRRERVEAPSEGVDEYTHPAAANS